MHNSRNNGDKELHLGRLTCWMQRAALLTFNPRPHASYPRSPAPCTCRNHNKIKRKRKREGKEGKKGLRMRGCIRRIAVVEGDINWRLIGLISRRLEEGLPELVLARILSESFHAAATVVVVVVVLRQTNFEVAGPERIAFCCLFCNKSASRTRGWQEGCKNLRTHHRPCCCCCYCCCHISIFGG